MNDSMLSVLLKYDNQWMGHNIFKELGYLKAAIMQATIATIRHGIK